MTLGGVSFSWRDVETSIELPHVYDGASVLVMKDGTMLNRWASDSDPDQPAPGYERRFYATKEWMEQEHGEA